MRFARIGFGLGALILVAAISSAAQPAGERLVTIRVSDMHCANCAKKISRKLYAVPGVVTVTTDVKAHTAVVTPQADRDPSLRALWEAVEKAGFKIIELSGPTGKHTSKPDA